MKRMNQIYLCLFVVLFAGLFGCQHQQNPFAVTSKAEFRSIAWNYLSEKARATVTNNWQEVEVILQDYNGQDLVWVIFNTKDNSLLGPIVVLIHPYSGNVIGIAPRL